LGSGTFDVNAPAAVNALAPAPVAPTAPANAMLQDAKVEKMRQQRNQFLAMGNPQAIAAARALDADIALLSKEPVYHNVPGVGLVDARNKQVVMAEVAKPTELQRNYEYARGQGFKGDIFAYEKALKEASRAPAQPVAPTITQIVDPTNPNQMIAAWFAIPRWNPKILTTYRWRF